MTRNRTSSRRRIWLSLALACVLLPLGTVFADGTADTSVSDEESISSSAQEQAQEQTQEEAPREAVLTSESESHKIRYSPEDDAFYQGGKLLREQWVDYLGERYFPNAQGHPYRNTFLRYHSTGISYYVGPTGIMQTGITKIADDYYYFLEDGDQKGQLVSRIGWQETGKGTVFVGPEAKLYHDRFITFGPKVKYYMGEEGVKQTGFVAAKGTIYDTDEDGRVKMHPHGYTYEGKYYYAPEGGDPYRDIFLNFGGGRIALMGEDGARQTGIVLYRGVAYRFDENGFLVKQSSSYEYNGKTYFAKPDGKPYRSRVLTFGSSYAMYMGADGTKQYGLVSEGGKAYYADPSTGNLMRNGGAFKVDGKTYYSGKDFALTKGWQKINGESYYFDPDAKYPARLENTTRTIDGYSYRFDANGKAKQETLYEVKGEWRYSGGYLTGPAVYDRYVGKNFAVISLDHQYMWVFHNGKLAVETPIISGKPSSPTVMGNFSVQEMAQGTYLIGPTWKSWVDYWISFSGGYGIHDASWQYSNNFYYNSRSYTWVGSHGCVNVLPSVMPRVYDALYTGSAVTVY